MTKNKFTDAKVTISRKKLGGEIPLIVNEITERCLYSGFFGTLDSARMMSINDKILDMLTYTGIEIVIIDLGNVDIIDSAVASHLVRLGETLSFVGAETIFCGIMPQVARIMVTTGIEMRRFRITRSLKSAVKMVYELQGLKLVDKEKLK